MTGLDKLLRWAPSQSALARQLGVTPQAIEGWKKRNQVPAERVLDIERITGGCVSRYELRPDLYGVQLLAERRKADRRQAARRQGDRHAYDERCIPAATIADR